MSWLSNATGVNIDVNKEVKKNPVVAATLAPAIAAQTAVAGSKGAMSALGGATGAALGGIPGGVVGTRLGGAVANEVNPQDPNAGGGPVGGGMPGQMTADQMRAARQADIEAGIETGKKYLPTGSLGRVSAATTPEMAAAQEAAKSIFTQGFGAPAFQAAREARLRGVNRDVQSQRQALAQAQARGGIGGALGASQAVNLARNQGQQRAQAEQDLLLQEVAQKRAALGDWQKMASQGEMFNLGQQAKETLAALGTGMAEGQMGVSERGGITQGQIGQAMANAMASQGGGKK